LAKFQQKPSKLGEFLTNTCVLVIEPTSNYRSSIKRFLQNMRATNIRFASDPIEAKREMLTCQVGFFIAEWLLPQQNGIEFCREMRESNAHANTPFLLLSTENLRHDVVLASESRIDGYLLKPFSFEDFQSQVETIIHAKAHPSKTSIMLADAKLKQSKGELSNAASLYKEVLREDANSAAAATGLGQIEAERKSYPAALEFFRQAMRMNPLFLDAYRGLIHVGELTKDYNSVIKAALKVMELSPNNPKYALILAKAYLNKGDFDKSRQFFRKTVTLSPRLAEAYKGLGDVYLAKKEYEDARKNYEKALDLDRTDISTLNSLGLTYVKQNKIGEGILKYKLALRIDPFDARVLFNLGYAYEKTGQLNQAIQAYQKAVHYKPNYEKALRRIRSLEKKAS